MPFYAGMSLLLLLPAIFACDGDSSAGKAGLAIVNGFVIDGTGGPGYRADVIIDDGRILAVGEGAARQFEAETTVDATGRVVCPGFIDPHAHGDPLAHPEFENFVAQGVTTVCLGQDGRSVTVGAMEDWMRAVDSLAPGVNIALFAGHATLRTEAGITGSDCSEAELDSLSALVSSAMNAGCFGISTGLEYHPGMLAGERELETIAKSTGRYGGLIMSHMRSEDDTELDRSMNEFFRQGADCRIHIAHLKSVYGKGTERAEEILAKISEARRRGVRVSADVYPYRASYTGIGILFPPWAKTSDQFDRALVSRREELEEYLYNRVMARNGPSATLFGGPPFTGMTLEEVAEASGTAFTDVLLKLGPESISAAYFVMDSALLHRLITDPTIVICSDGSPTMHHPRGYGAFTRILREYVKEKRSLSFELAIHKMTGLTARTVGIPDRGTLTRGAYADIAIIDTTAIADLATFTEPHRLARGVKYTIVNGHIAREADSKGVRRHGKMLRRKAPTH